MVARDADSLAIQDPKVFVTDCDAKEARTALPLAAVRVAGRLFWVMEEDGYEDERYVIAEIRPTGVQYAIKVNGGGC